MDDEVRTPAGTRSHGWKRWARPGLLVVAAPLALVLAACGSSGYGDRGADASEQPAKVRTADRPDPATTLAVGTINGGRRVLTDADGLTLYRFDQDGRDVSACNGACATTWPPLAPPADGRLEAAPGLPGTPGVITRTDGTEQVTLDGVPLYRYSGDQARGDAVGDGFSGVWHVWSVGGEPVDDMTMGGGY
jgi:predicted lipoprotein with Yx(FWY)xxD motif